MRLWGDNAPSWRIRLGTVLVTIMVTQNLVSIVFSSSIASRDASLLPLTRLNWRPCRRASTSPCGSQGQRAKRALMAASRQSHTNSALCVQQGLHQSASEKACLAQAPPYTNCRPFSSIAVPKSWPSSPKSISLCAAPDGIMGKQFSSLVTRQSKITGPS